MGAFAGGATGWLATWYAVGSLRMTPGDWMQTAGLFAVVIGWLVSHQMTLSAQRAQVRDQVLNEGRLAVSQALEQQRRAVNYAATCMAAFASNSHPQQPENLSASGWKGLGDDLRNGGMSVEVMRAYEQVFPKTKFVREELSRWQDELYGDLYRFYRGEMARTSETAGQLFVRCGQLLGFLDELRVHVQNEALAEIMGHRTARTKRVGYTGTLTLDTDGNLHLPSA